MKLLDPHDYIDAMRADLKELDRKRETLMKAIGAMEALHGSARTTHRVEPAGGPETNGDRPKRTRAPRTPSGITATEVLEAVNCFTTSVTAAQIAELLGKQASLVSAHISNLVTAGKVKRLARGVYARVEPLASTPRVLRHPSQPLTAPKAD